MHIFFFTILSIIFIVSPYAQGLYFATDFYGLQLVINSLFLVLMIRIFVQRQELLLLQRSMMFLLLPLCYLIPLPVAASMQTAWDMWLNFTTYATFFIMLYWTTMQHNIYRWLPIIFQCTGIWLVYHMFLVQYGFIAQQFAYNVERFAGVFQYANTYGLVMSVVYLFSLLILINITNHYRTFVFYGVTLVPSLVCMLQSYSRGTMIIFPIVWFLGLILLSVSNQIRYVMYTVISILFTSLVYFTDAQNGQSISLHVIILIVCIVSSIIIMLLSSRIVQRILVVSDKMIQYRWARTVMPVSMIVIFIAAAIDLHFHGLLYRMLSADLQVRINSISLATATAKERLIYWQDAWRMSLDAPFIGLGGGSWSIKYRAYQQLPYISNKIHNGYIEWLVDTGWLGLLTFLGVLSALFIIMIRHYRQHQEETKYVAVLVSITAILLHSVLDFNFSYGTIWFILVWLFVMGVAPVYNKVTSPSVKVSPKQSKRSKTENAVIRQRDSIPIWQVFVWVMCSISAIIAIMFTYRFITAEQLFQEAKTTTLISRKLDIMNEAVSYNPYQLDYVTTTNTIYARLIQRNQSELTKQQWASNVANMVAVEPGNSNVYERAVRLLEQTGDRVQALRYCEQWLRVDHYNTQLYEIRMKILIELAQEAKSAGNSVEMKKLATLALTTFQNNEHWFNIVVHHPLFAEANSFNERKFVISEQVTRLRSEALQLMQQN